MSVYRVGFLYVCTCARGACELFYPPCLPCGYRPTRHAILHCSARTSDVVHPSSMYHMEFMCTQNLVPLSYATVAEHINSKIAFNAEPLPLPCLGRRLDLSRPTNAQLMLLRRERRNKVSELTTFQSYLVQTSVVTSSTISHVEKMSTAHQRRLST